MASQIRAFTQGHRCSSMVASRWAACKHSPHFYAHLAAWYICTGLCIWYCKCQINRPLCLVLQMLNIALIPCAPVSCLITYAYAFASWCCEWQTCQAHDCCHHSLFKRWAVPSQAQHQKAPLRRISAGNNLLQPAYAGGSDHSALAWRIGTRETTVQQGVHNTMCIIQEFIALARDVSLCNVCLRRAD